MKKHILFILFSLGLAYLSNAQSYPSFQADVFDSTTTGYYFTCPIRVGANPTGIPPTHTILDKNGHLVYYRKFPLTVNSGDFKLNANGQMSYSVQARFFIMDSTFTVVDTVFCQNGITQDGHDVQILSNGNYLVMGYENATMDLSSYPIFNQNGTPGSATATVRGGVIQELDANKNIVFEWHALDYYDFDDVDTLRLDNPANVDWTHFNSVEEDTDGNLLISLRHFNEITKISRLDGSVIWRFGGKRNQFTFLNDPNQFWGQHDCRRISNGNITLFDNGANTVPFSPASAKEYQLDETALTAKLVWSYVETPNQFSRGLGSVQRMANGNTLINYGLFPGTTVVFNEVDSLGNKVFELRYDADLVSYRSYHYDQLPWQLHQPQITCVKNGNSYFLDAGSGHNNYQWSTGATTQTIPLTTSGTYFVYVPRGPGFISSELFKVTDAANPCGLSGTTAPDAATAFSIQPNPSTDRVMLSLPEAATGTVEITNLIGRCILRTPITQPTADLTLDLADLPPGVYLVRLNGYCLKMIKQ